MYPIRVLSFNNAWNLLNENKKEEWQDIQTALLEFSEETLDDRERLFPEATGDDEEGDNEEDDGDNEEDDEEGDNEEGNENRPKKSTVSYIAMAMEIAYARRMTIRGWDIIENNSYTNKSMSINRGVIKNSVSNFIFNTKYSAENFNDVVYINSQISQISGLSDLTVIVVPSEEAFKNFVIDKKSSIFDPFYEKICRDKISQLKSLKNLSPILFAFYSPHNSAIEIEEVLQEKVSSIERELVFPPQYYQAGVTVLSNFGEILRQKYPNINSKVRIEQEGNTVRMHIELPEGEIKVAEETLEDYFLVVRDKAPPSLLLDDKVQIMVLENRLDLIKSDLRSSERAYKLAMENKEEVKVEHNKVVVEFQRLLGQQSIQIAQQSSQINTLLQLQSQQISSSERVQLAQIGHAQGLFKDLLGEAQGNQVTFNAIKSLEHNLMSGLATIEVQEQIKESLATIQQSSPGIIARVAAQIESAGYGVLAAPALEWLQQHLK